jgi:hypothetical protein
VLALVFGRFVTGRSVAGSSFWAFLDFRFWIFISGVVGRVAADSGLYETGCGLRIAELSVLKVFWAKDRGRGGRGSVQVIEDILLSERDGGG